MTVGAAVLIAQPASATVYSPYGHANFVADCSRDSGMVAQTISMYGHRGQRLEYRKWAYSEKVGRWVAGPWLGGYTQIFEQSQAYLRNQGKMWLYAEYRWATAAGWVYRTEYSDTYQTVGFYAPSTYRVTHCQM